MAIPHTLTALKRYSTLPHALPSISRITQLHVYDFDNTLFKTPLPNRALWESKTLGHLMNADYLQPGGWWHNLSILSATGAGLAVEEGKAWEGWWNESIVELVRMSMEAEDVLTVLLTGRAEGTFGELVGRIVKSKGLEFDMHVLKPAVGLSNERFGTTMEFKQVFLGALVNTYASAESLTIYEDRERHVDGFRNWVEDFNEMTRVGGVRGPIDGVVVPVRETGSTLDPLAEATAVQVIINSHNRAILAGTAGERFKPLYIKKFPIGFGRQGRQKERFKLSIELEPDPSAPIGDAHAPLPMPIGSSGSFRGGHQKQHGHRPHNTHKDWRKGFGRERGRGRGRVNGPGNRGVFKRYKDPDAQRGGRRDGGESNLYSSY
jgi:hypothetical protein